LPDLVLGQLGHLKHLGIHSGIITDALVPLIESGIVDNEAKKKFRGVSVTTMAAGSQPFYNFLHRNRAVEFHPCSLTHNHEILSGIERLCAINSVLQIDLQGNANAEVIGGKVISSPGGLPDFARGAAHARDGKSILALRSSSKDGRQSNILLALPTSAPTSVPGEHVDFVVTEYGIAALRGLSADLRAKSLISIAHPAFRDELERDFEMAKGQSS
jgi:4-hydroxybutyrate CoA-transferase